MKMERMKSKQALNKISHHLIGILELDDPELIKLVIHYTNMVKKDLDILELLKSKHVDIAELKEDGNVIIYNLSMMKQDLLTEEEFKMLKEWLEND